jgi:hypothetical protein
MITPQLNERLSSGTQLLKEITEGEFSENRLAVDSVMRTFFELGRALGQEPVLAKDPAVSSFLKEAQERIDRLFLSLDMYVMRTEYLLASAWEHEEWFVVCERRSAIEFVKTLLDVPENALDTTEIDAQIVERGREESIRPLGGVEPGIPQSHWWWFLN